MPHPCPQQPGCGGCAGSSFSGDSQYQKLESPSFRCNLPNNLVVDFIPHFHMRDPMAPERPSGLVSPESRGLCWSPEPKYLSKHPAALGRTGLPTPYSFIIITKLVESKKGFEGFLKARDLCPAWEWVRPPCSLCPSPMENCHQDPRSWEIKAGPGRASPQVGDQVCKQEVLWLPGWIRSGGASLQPFIWSSKCEGTDDSRCTQRSSGGWSWWPVA